LCLSKKCSPHDDGDDDDDEDDYDDNNNSVCVTYLQLQAIKEIDTNRIRSYDHTLTSTER
jgi:hypothetical protein